MKHISNSIDMRSRKENLPSLLRSSEVLSSGLKVWDLKDSPHEMRLSDTARAGHTTADSSTSEMRNFPVTDITSTDHESPANIMKFPE